MTTSLVDTRKGIRLANKTFLDKLKLIQDAHYSLSKFLSETDDLTVAQAIEELEEEPEVLVKINVLKINESNPERTIGRYKLVFNIMWDSAPFRTNPIKRTKFIKDKY